MTCMQEVDRVPLGVSPAAQCSWRLTYVLTPPSPALGLCPCPFLLSAVADLRWPLVSGVWWTKDSSRLPLPSPKPAPPWLSPRPNPVTFANTFSRLEADRTPRGSCFSPFSSSIPGRPLPPEVALPTKLAFLSRAVPASLPKISRYSPRLCAGRWGLHSFTAQTTASEDLRGNWLVPAQSR